MGIRIDGASDLINATDGSLTIEGQSINSTGIGTFSGGVKVGSAATIHSTGQFNIGVAATIFASGNATFAGITTTAGSSVQGRLLVNQSSNYTVYGDNKLQISATDGTAGLSVTRWSNNGSSPYINLGKSRGAEGAYTVVQDGDRLGQINFAGADGTDLASHAASIAGYVDGTPGSNDMPGRIIFATSSDGGVAETERLRIDSSGKLSTGAESSPDVSAGGLCLNQGAADTNIVSLKSSDIAHGVTTLDETDTYFSIRKSSGDKGGARIHGFTDAAGADPGLEIMGIINSDADQSYCPIELKGAEANGTGIQNIAADRRIVQIKNSDGTRIASFTGTGLTFGDDSAAANALNDYEEGIVTWASTNNGDISFNSSYKGRYTKIGELVTVSGYLLIDSYTSSSTAIRVTLPFTSAANGEGYYSRGVGATFNKNMNFPSNYENMVAYIGGGEDYMRFYMSRQTGGSADWHQMRAQDFTSTTGIYFSVCYTTTA